MLPRKGVDMIRVLPVLIEVGLLVFCLIQVIQTPADECRNLPKVAWIILIIILPVVGGIAWLVAGRPTAQAQPGWRIGGGFPERERPRPSAPDDDPEFLAQLRKVDSEQEAMLKEWEENLRRREQQLRDEKDGGHDEGRPGTPG